MKKNHHSSRIIQFVFYFYMYCFWKILRSVLRPMVKYGPADSRGAFHLTKNPGNSGCGSEWNRHFPEFHSEILGVASEVGLKFRKIGITGKFCSI